MMVAGREQTSLMKLRNRLRLLRREMVELAGSGATGPVLLVLVLVVVLVRGLVGVLLAAPSV